MDAAIQKHFNQNIKEKTRLTGGFTFNTWLLTLENGRKVVFRTRDDFQTRGGRKILISDTFEREKFFYDRVNKEIGHICPTVYIIDDSREDYPTPYQISEYIEGTPLSLCFDTFDRRIQDEIQYKLGEITAKIHRIEIDKAHNYVSSRGTWEEFFAGRLQERLMPFIKDNIITASEITEIIEAVRRVKAYKTHSFIHLDLRYINMIYNGGDIYILDAENCEFGDPLFDLAVMDLNDNLSEAFLSGYRNMAGSDFYCYDGLFYFYKMERQALVLDVFMNVVRHDKETTRRHLAGFMALKGRLLKGI